jgi:hypothetical protein
VAVPLFAADLQSTQASYDNRVLPLIQKYCYQCHGNGQHKADFAIDSFKSVDAMLKESAAWRTLAGHVRANEMPPPEAKAQPTLEEREIILNWIEKELFGQATSKPDPGRVTIRRLNKSEYNNTIRDLVGIDFQPAEDFPSDDTGYGFDTIGDVLSLSPVLMEKYLAAATRILDQALPTEPIRTTRRRFNANLMEMGFNATGDRGDGWMPLGALEEDGLSTAIDVPAGDYVVRVLAFPRARGELESPLKLSLQLDNAIIHDWEVTSTEENPGTYEYRLGVSAGKHRFKVLNRRIRGGNDELSMRNGRIGREQQGVLWVKWVEIEGPVSGHTMRFPGHTLQATGPGRTLPSGARVLTHNGQVAASFDVPAEGEYLLRAQVYAQQAGAEYVRMNLNVDGQTIKEIDVVAPAALVPIDGQRVFSMELLRELPYVYEVRQKLSPGTHQFAAAFVNDLEAPNAENPNYRDRNLYVDYLEVVNLSGAQPLPPKPPQIAALFTNPNPPNAADAAREILNRFVTRAWRRPVQAAEIGQLMNLFALAQSRGESFEASVKLPMKAALVSPHFLFRGEVQPDPDNPASVHPVNEHALASRLSYFLWSSMPDEELLELAGKNELRKNLDAQIRRMLASPKADALAENFSGQWLQTRNLKFVDPDKDVFYGYDKSLGQDMATETLLFFKHIMRQDRSVLDFMTGKYTFVNQRLAEYYGIPDVVGEQFREVSLAGTPRIGVLTQGSVLTITSNPTRTSPVLRGKWVLDNLLGTPPPPPPPDVPELENDGRPTTGTLRQQMEKHRESPTCASCHARMDPIGFGLEAFDGIGKWREKDGDFPVDTAGELVTGEKFSGAVELVNILATNRREEFLRNLADKMLIYALGRGTEYYDQPAIDRIVAGMKADELKFSSLIREVVNSVPFQMRRGEAAATAGAK